MAYLVHPNVFKDICYILIIGFKTIYCDILESYDHPEDRGVLPMIHLRSMLLWHIQVNAKFTRFIINHENMERRQAIKSLLAVSASTMLFTRCTESNVIEFLKDDQLLLNTKHKNYLGIISESILPIKSVSDKIEPASDFILRMLNDCRSSEDITRFALGFDQYKIFISEAQASISLDDAERAVELMKTKITATEPSEELIYFLQEVKNLSIQNLKTSAFYLTQKTDYQLIPEAYQACTEI